MCLLCTSVAAHTSGGHWFGPCKGSLASSQSAGKCRPKYSPEVKQDIEPWLHVLHASYAMQGAVKSMLQEKEEA